MLMNSNFRKTTSGKQQQKLHPELNDVELIEEGVVDRYWDASFAWFCLREAGAYGPAAKYETGIREMARRSPEKFVLLRRAFPNALEFSIEETEVAGRQPTYWGVNLTAPATSGTTAGFPS
jgi:hypothetical protein